MTRPATWLPLLAGLAMVLGSFRSPADEVASGQGDPSARLPRAPLASEYWNLTAAFDGGYRLFSRFGITNEGPGERTAGALWYLVHPDGHVSDFRNGRSQSRWTLSPDRLYIDIASSSLDLHAPVRRLDLDTTSQGGKISLHFPADGPALWPAVPSTEKFHSDTLQIAAPIEGTIWVRGMLDPVAVRGTTTLTHAWMNDSLPDLVQAQIEFVGHTADLTVYLSDVGTPGGAHRHWLVVERAGAIAYQSVDFELLPAPPDPATADRRYPVPGRLLARDQRVTLEVGSERLLLRTNPLAGVPQPFRFLFSLKIDPRFFWADTSFRLKLAAAPDGVPREAEGRGILAVIFVNPAPAK